jgi:hypothetical protein
MSISDAINATERNFSSRLRKKVRKFARNRIAEESEALKRLDAILEQAATVTEKRNRLLHGLWARELDGEPVRRSEGTAFRQVPTVRELEEVAEEMARITDEIMEARLNGFLREALRRAPLPPTSARAAAT